jgi:hypothetical protein
MLSIQKDDTEDVPRVQLEAYAIRGLEGPQEYPRRCPGRVSGSI